MEARGGTATSLPSRGVALSPIADPAGAFEAVAAAAAAVAAAATGAEGANSGRPQLPPVSAPSPCYFLAVVSSQGRGAAGAEAWEAAALALEALGCGGGGGSAGGSLGSGTAPPPLRLAVVVPPGQNARVAEAAEALLRAAWQPGAEAPVLLLPLDVALWRAGVLYSRPL